MATFRPQPELLLATEWDVDTLSVNLVYPNHTALVAICHGYSCLRITSPYRVTQAVWAALMGVCIPTWSE